VKARRSLRTTAFAQSASGIKEVVMTRIGSIATTVLFVFGAAFVLLS
jgi:hypothetical protein